MRKLMIVLMGMFVLAAPAFASDAGCPGTNGGDLPMPFLTANLRVELAHGEYYILKGKIQLIASKPYFKVDLKEQPWLKNAERESNPYYQIERTGLIDWKKYDKQYVEMYVRAERKIVVSHGNYHNSELRLNSWLEPKVISPAPVEGE